MNVGTIQRKNTKAEEEAKELARHVEATMDAHFGRSEPASTIPFPLPYNPASPYVPVEIPSTTRNTNLIEITRTTDQGPKPLRTILDIAKELLELPAREWIKVPADVQKWATGLMYNEWE